MSFSRFLRVEKGLSLLRFGKTCMAISLTFISRPSTSEAGPGPPDTPRRGEASAHPLRLGEALRATILSLRIELVEPAHEALRVSRRLALREVNVLVEHILEGRRGDPYKDRVLHGNQVTSVPPPRPEICLAYVAAGRQRDLLGSLLGDVLELAGAEEEHRRGVRLLARAEERLGGRHREAADGPVAEHDEGLGVDLVQAPEEGVVQQERG
eukprot:CAMPEP_0168456344 /NCGR_PEP_ID=MMETSP0228-20121227/51242_1 /TAXON_ID=133427 /ORGANISM="Protoceratium reticulatum, Strain CCCM 535 (=CCMP 1889)" /LENGTH=210 /DNA_ID=CAMNT_0008471267 /DNA_START=42 /DNA_END=669 /DNA_ORIENTATION=+